MELVSYFIPIFKAILIILIIGVVSALLLRKNILKSVHIESLSHITVIVLLPCLTFGKILRYFNPEDFAYWWTLPLAALIIIGMGLGISSLFYLKQLKNKRAYIAMSGFMNANYMVLPIGQLVFKDNFDEFAAYTFLFLIGVIPLLWSVGKFMVTSDVDSKLSLKSLLTPPLIASLLAILFVLTHINKFIPEIVMQPIDFMGQAAIPSATLILGATVGSISLRKTPPLADILKVLSTKLLILPAIVIFIILQTNLAQNYPLIADLLVIQSSVPAASQLIIQVKKYGGDVQNLGSIMFFSYAFCLITIPVWFTVWNMLK